MIHFKCAGCRKERCNGCSLYQQLNTGKKKGAVVPEDFTPDRGQGYGMAFDVGTTTIAGLLWDLEKGVQLEAQTQVNPGRYAGSDVVSRMTFVRNTPGQREKIQRMMVDTLDGMAKEAAKVCGEPISRVVIAGNTVMCELLLLESMDGLAKAPFHKDYTGSRRCKGKDLGFVYLQEAEITLLPAVEGFVGGDALAVYTCMKHQDGRKHVLVVDIGTNGEVILFGKEQTFACSAAAGPALEGAAVLSGMGACEGAVSEVRVLGSFPREDIFCKVIGKGAPKGICGSGLVDGLAALREIGVVDETGYLCTAMEARRAGVREQFCRRIDCHQGENRFLLTNQNNPVFLTGGDIRQLQLAKGAIRAGIEILLGKEQIRADELAHIYIAGSFGSFIRKESAVEIGLLPRIPLEKISHIGNCAGTGASMALLSGQIIKEMERDAELIRHVELAEEEGFQACFLESLGIR